MSNHPLDLTLFNDESTIWHAKDWKKLRAHRISGSFIGNIPHLSHQIRENGLPLLLTKNETQLLLEKKLAVLKSCDELLEEPDEEILQEFQEQRRQSLSDQAEELKELRRQEILDKADSIVSGKLSKRLKLNNSAAQDLEDEREKIISNEIAKIPQPDIIHLMILTYTGDPWLKGEKCDKWDYPKTEKEKLEYHTFRTLWEMGYWVTPGGKFGGDFLVYMGDPFLHHASFIVRLTTVDHMFSPLEIASLVRLANTTRKTAVLAYFDSNRTINFQSFAWCAE